MADRPAYKTLPAPRKVKAGSGGAPAGSSLTYRPPGYPSYTGYTALSISNANLDVLQSLDPATDYKLTFTEKITRATSTTSGVRIIGGRNIVIIGLEIENTNTGNIPQTDAHWGLYCKDQRGTLHVEGLKIYGLGIGGAIVLDQAYASTIQLQNCWINANMAEDPTYIHPDDIQTWRGPAVLKLDRFTGYTTSKAFNFQPHEYEQNTIGTWDLRRWDVHGPLDGTPEGSYLLWLNDWTLSLAASPGMAGPVGRWPISSLDGYVDRDPTRSGTYYYQGASGVILPHTVGVPPGGEWCPQSVPGVGYVSPGYVAVRSVSRPKSAATGRPRFDANPVTRRVKAPL